MRMAKDPFGIKHAQQRSNQQVDIIEVILDYPGSGAAAITHLLTASHTIQKIKQSDDGDVLDGIFLSILLAIASLFEQPQDNRARNHGREHNRHVKQGCLKQCPWVNLPCHVRVGKQQCRIRQNDIKHKPVNFKYTGSEQCPPQFHSHAMPSYHMPDETGNNARVTFVQQMISYPQE